MRIFPAGKVMLKAQGAPMVGMYQSWFGSTYIGAWVGSRLLERLVRQWAILSEAVVTYIKQKPKTTTVKKRAG